MKLTTIKDYYQQLYDKFPGVPKQDIRRILNYGWKQLYLCNSYGGDTFIRDRELWCYIGRLTNDPLKHFEYYIHRLVTRIRVLYRRRKIKWDGYYYFALTANAYQKYLAQKNSTGRPKKHFKFTNVFMYQILEECKIAESAAKYIFRIPYISTVKYKFYIPELKTDKAELIITREPLKFKDILTSTNDYELL